MLRKSEYVNEITDEIHQLVQDLADTLNVAGGVGLSAPQICEHQRVIYLACPDITTEMINPTIKSTDSLCKMEEGCLSFPGVVEMIPRYSKITVEYTTLDGDLHVDDLEGLPAQVVQHEIEHLDGKLMIDNLSRLKRSRASTRVKKVQKEVNNILDIDYDDIKITKIKRNAHLSRKEIKNRRRRRKQNR